MINFLQKSLFRKRSGSEGFTSQSAEDLANLKTLSVTSHKTINTHAVDSLNSGNTLSTLNALDARLSNSSSSESEKKDQVNETKNSQKDDEDEINEEDLYPNGGIKAYTVVFGSFCCCVTLFGMMDSIGVIEAYVQIHQLSTTAVSSISWIFSIFMFISMFLGIITGPLYDLFGSQQLLVIGAGFTFVGIFCTGECTEVYQFVLSFGICLGLGTGFMMTPAVSAVSSWFGKGHRAFFLGIVQSGGSVGGVIFPILLRSMFPKHGFKWSMRILAFLNLGLDIIGAFLAKDRLKELKHLQGKSETGTIWDKIKHSIDPKAFKDRSFLFLTLSLFLNEFADTIVLTYISSYAISQGVSQQESYNMVTILNALGIIGSYIPSYLANAYGAFNMMALVSGTLTLVIFIIWLPFGQYKAALYVFVSIFGFCCASTFALTGATISEVTKKTSDFGKRYGTAYSFVSFGCLLSLPISGAFIRQKTNTYYRHMVIFNACMSLLATFFFLLTRYTIVGRKIKVAV
ncbi:hypothetical protein BRETT_004690 [Brettanomyces bruxellensis]|uniref:Major facilitator superfamily (MFS) profile domain-containing protein n=2 Tax=Dekkera bruxellensis TaxID=5007 RepID=A0A871RAC9_DEKBR|nr:uncharacterized protein BRETT_004690 [Brettanomyces bruxellensis]QOU20042.1 hypothetical protein BRETT_004690 [Brettanomyces bruxellensis]